MYKYVMQIRTQQMDISMQFQVEYIRRMRK